MQMNFKTNPESMKLFLGLKISWDYCVCTTIDLVPVGSRANLVSHSELCNKRCNVYARTRRKSDLSLI